MTSDDSPLQPRRLLWTAGIWGGIGLFDATQTVISMQSMGMHHAWARLFLFEVLGWATWALATPLVMHLGDRFPLALRRPGAVRAVVLHAGTWLALCLGSAMWTTLFEHGLNPWTPDAAPPAILPRFLDRLHDQLLSSLFIYYCILMAGHALSSRVRLARQRAAAAELAEQLAQAKLDALRHQIEPHFLFNALNAISGLVREQQTALAVQTIARVSEFLRHALQDGSTQEVALEEELRFASLYLDIQRLRFGDRLDARVDVAPELGGAMVPRLILQPLVENAIKHGISMRAQPGALHIGAVRTPTALVVTLYNDGPAIAANDATGAAASPPRFGTMAAPPPRTGAIGLANVRLRLQGLYGAGGALAVANVVGRGVQVTLTVPWREQGAA